MNRENRIIQLRHQLDRSHSLLERVDVKGNLIMAYHSLVVGGVVVNYSAIEKLLLTPCFSFESAVITLSISSLLSMFFAFRAVYPFLKVGIGEGAKSLIAFPGVIQNDEELFQNKINLWKEKELEEDLVAQVFSLAKTLDFKFKRIKWAGVLCYVHLLIAVSLLIQHLL